MVLTAVQPTRRHAPPPHTQQARMLRPLFLLPLLLLCLLYSLSLPVSAQLAFLVPDTCPLQRFDISSLSCAACPTHASVPSSNLLSQQCVCDAGYRKVASATDAYGFTCTDCIGSGLAARSDRAACMACSTTQGATLSTITRDCACPAGQILVERDLGGTLFPDGKRCVACSSSTQVFPATDAYTCQTCPDSRMSMDATGACTCETGYTSTAYGESSVCVLSTSLNQITTLYSPVSAAQMQFNDVQSQDSSSSYAYSPQVSSIYVKNFFAASATNCYVLHERSACQALANMCVLQKYHVSSIACRVFQVVQGLVATYEHGFVTASGGVDGWRTGMPFLYESTGVLTTSSQLIQTEVTLTNTHTTDNSKTGTMQFKLYSYTFNGTFIGSESLSSQLQLCGGDSSLLTNFLRFGTNYENSCTLDLSSLLYRSADQTVFYEIFLVDINSKLYPLPVKILNLRLGDGSTPNRNSDDSESQSDSNVLTRRFYIVDSMSGRTNFGSATPVVLSYLQSATLRVEMRGSSNSVIRPPVLVVSYGEREAASIQDGAKKAQAHVMFKVEYIKDAASFDRASIALFITALVLGLLMVIRRLWVWQRKTGSEVLEINLMLFVRFVVYLFSALGDLFFIMLCCLSFYCWLFYKGQQTVYYLLPAINSSEVGQLQSFAIVCFIAKLSDVAFKIYNQIQVEVFFMDWEKPKGALEHGNSDDESAPPPTVSVWRRLFAANKWNDLQCVRLINVPLTLFLMMFLLEPSGIGLKYLATAQPSPSNLAASAAPLHPILLYAVVVFFLLGICYLQLLFHRQITHRYFKDEAAQFVDLLCTSNISCMVLDERQHGWYVHGKTVHPYADVSLEEMNAAISAEEKNLTRARGLDVDGSGVGGGAGGDGGGKDTFELYATHAWRATYDDLYTRLLHKQSVHQARAQRSAARGNMDMSSEVEMGLGGRGGVRAGLGGMGTGHHNQAGGRDDWNGGHGGGGAAVDSQHLISHTLMRANASLNVWLTSFINREPQFPYPYDHAVHDPTRRILGLPVALPHNAPCTLFDDPDFRFTEVLLCGIENDLILFLVQLYAVCTLLFDSILVATLACYVVDRLMCGFRAHWGQINIAKKTLLDDRFLI